MVSITVQFNFSYALSFRFLLLWQPLIENGARSELSHIGRWQGDQARYVGTRKNLFDLRRTAVVHNLHVLAKIFTYTTV